jgi:hypothetical protein
MSWERREQARRAFAARALKTGQRHAKTSVALEAKALGWQWSCTSSRPRGGDGGTSINEKAFGGLYYCAQAFISAATSLHEFL